jgi:hypothetical protein
LHFASLDFYHTAAALAHPASMGDLQTTLLRSLQDRLVLSNMQFMAFAIG